MSSPSRTDPFAEYLPRCWKSALGAEAVDSAESLLDDASHGPQVGRVMFGTLEPVPLSGTTVTGFRARAVRAGPKRPFAMESRLEIFAPAPRVDWQYHQLRKYDSLLGALGSRSAPCHGSVVCHPVQFLRLFLSKKVLAPL